ncbi:tRNA adenosine(34) deaminase TadA [Marinagarivorans algicola]|uniref:tRNA adenosine(34) deaminase TadA n=1 Tax=Marinagarivorans algicola TaxID=1513270 RepID=UPI000A8C4965|nr:tRNA adenosine(34) deaminase TadA [Marinagarivorans algicola]
MTHAPKAANKAATAQQARNDTFYMHLALQQARKAYSKGEVPVGAVLVAGDQVIGSGFNQPITATDPTAHAEMQALRAGSQTIHNYRLPATTLYVTVEPCTMCLGALIHARVQRVVLAALEPKAGRICSHSLLDDACFNHRLEVTVGVCAQAASDLMQAFFAERRALKKSLKQRALLASRHQA